MSAKTVTARTGSGHDSILSPPAGPHLISGRVPGFAAVVAHGRWFQSVSPSV
jgi:hypothetical protein